MTSSSPWVTNQPSPERDRGQSHLPFLKFSPVSGIRGAGRWGAGWASAHPGKN